jgi:predicted lipoprotein with Yx(FWY)xxD motif
MNMFSIRSGLLAIVAIAAAAGLAACGGSDDNGSSATAATSSSSNDTVAMQTIGDAGSVLVDTQGNALYTPDQEANGKILCTGECASEWMPLTVKGNANPTAASDVSGKVGTVKRPDGSEQVTLDGAPLYTFAEDGGPGQVTGDGEGDSFGGQSFTWHVIGGEGATGSGGGSQSDSSDSSSSGGYSY